MDRQALQKSLKSLLIGIPVAAAIGIGVADNMCAYEFEAMNHKYGVGPNQIEQGNVDVHDVIGAPGKTLYWFLHQQ